MRRLILALPVALLLSLALIAGSLASASMTPLSPERQHPETARLIAKLLTYQHFNKQPIDDRLSARVMDTYLDQLDPDRYYFLASDIEEFHAYRERLDDMLLDGDLSIPYAIFNRLRERTAERTEHALSVLEGGFDLNTDRSIDLDRSEADWAEDTETMNRVWRDRIKHDALTLLLAGEEEEQTMDLLNSRYEGMAKNMERSGPEDVFEAFMGAWGRAFDPHTSYLSPRNSREFDIQMQLSLEGIGAVLRTHRDFTEVVELIPGGPASQDGQLQPGDRIIGVGQEGEDMVDVVGWRLRDVVDLIRGPKESEVRLRVLPASGGSDAAPRTIPLVRNEVALEEQAAQKSIEEVLRDGDTYRIGVITIPAFYADFAAAQAGDENYRSTTRDVVRLLGELAEEDINGLVIDLRGNAGGSLQEAASLTGLFINGGPVVQIRRSDGDTEVLRDRDGGITYEGPLTVMVDRFSASASEIFAGAIQDYGRGIVVGERTFGKGTVQSLVDLNRFTSNQNTEAGRLKLTIAKFYRVSGSSTQKRGVEPDLHFPSRARSDSVGESAAENALPWDEIREANYSSHGDLGGLLPLLLKRHEERSGQDPGFQALVAELEKQNTVANRTVVSLNRERRRSERDESNALQLEKANERRAVYGLEPLSDLDALRMADDEPDVLLKSTADITTDLFLVHRSPSMARRWSAELAAD
ncbi:carboxyl-terminal processing protease [Natronocella acetinitrilica]|uniref:Carboxyl-terminal processing protease n=1 Tax=Natronocella acetinitrilica TaxID=414046 RepID=A0AAE3KDE7_9GAMM|nr:carboxy terminal-processing peptidase [Natronocella acetinitrilica]MCP1676188.1 carboxyl-terminal processing protease [Natronocella acetinitrilica]